MIVRACELQRDVGKDQAGPESRMSQTRWHVMSSIFILTERARQRKMGDGQTMYDIITKRECQKVTQT